MSMMDTRRTLKERFVLEGNPFSNQPAHEFESNFPRIILLVLHCLCIISCQKRREWDASCKLSATSPFRRERRNLKEP